MSDSLEGMPEFDKPENIPLVVPDKRKLRSDHCAGIKKDGTPCGFAHQKTSAYCIQHDPAISAEQKQAWRKVPRKPRVVPHRTQNVTYKSREEILAILSKRLDVWIREFGDVMKAEVDNAICDLCRTYAAIMRIEGEGAQEVRGWRMKGTG